MPAIDYEANILRPAAAEAAECAIDVHGPDGCDAEMAYEFIRELWLEQDQPDAEYLPEQMPKAFAALFAEAYEAEKRNRP